MAVYKFQRKIAANVVIETTSYIPEIERRAGSRLSRVVDEESMLMLRDMQLDIMSGPKTGRIYIRRRGIVHQASAPGEAPANETGNLVVHLIRRMVKPLMAEIDTQNNEYAAALELGRLDGSIAPRPFFAKNVRKRAVEFLQRAQAVIDNP